MMKGINLEYRSVIFRCRDDFTPRPPDLSKARSYPREPTSW